MDIGSLSDDDRKALAADVAEELDTGRYGSRFVLSRRQLLSIAGGSAGVAGLTALGVDPATAQSAAGQVGTQSSPETVYAFDLDVQNGAEFNGTDVTGVGSLSTGFTANDYSGPLVVGGSYDGDAQGINLEPYDDGTEAPGISDKAPARWYDSDGVFLAQMLAHRADNHWSLYTGDGSGNPLKRMNVDIGPGDVAANLINIDLLELESQNGNPMSLEVIARQTDSPAQLRLRAGKNSAPAGFRHRWNPGTNKYNFFNEVTGEQIYVVDGSDSTWRWDQNIPSMRFNGIETRNVAWENGTTADRPNSPSYGERFFDSDLGQPIWFNGSNWVDAQGDTV